MPQIQNSDWTPPTASRKNPRDGGSSTQSRGGQQAVDSWRSYSNDTRTLQAGIAEQTSPNAGFDPDSQVFTAQTNGVQNTIQTPYRMQAPRYRSNVRSPSQRPTQVEDHQRQNVNAAPRYQADAQWPQYGYRQAGAPSPRAIPSEPRRYHNDLQARPQQSCQPAGGSWRAPQPTFVQQVPMRPSSGVDRPRGYSASRLQYNTSVERQHGAPNRAVGGSGRRNYARERTPKCEYTGAPQPSPPVASQAYLTEAHLPPEMLKEPRRLLVILDLNGTLMLKPKSQRPKDIYIRPGAQQLLEYLFASHIVQVYTSAQPHNAESVSRVVFSEAQYDKLAAIWARDKLDLTPAQYRGKVQVYKKLAKIWADNEIQSTFFPPGSGKWDQTNTILVDDSHLKALQEPHNLLQVVEFTGKPNGLTRKAFNKHEEQICSSLVMKLEVLKWQNDVSRLIWRWQTGKAEIPKLPGTNFFVDEKVDQKEQARKDLESAMNLPTPQSPETTDSEGSEENGGNVLATKHLEASISPEMKRSESPVDEVVFKKLLAPGKLNTRHIRAPDSLGAEQSEDVIENQRSWGQSSAATVAEAYISKTRRDHT